MALYVKRFNEMEAAAPVDMLTARLDKLITLLERQYQQPLQIEQKPKYNMDELKKR